MTEALLTEAARAKSLRAQIKAAEEAAEDGGSTTAGELEGEAFVDELMRQFG